MKRTEKEKTINGGDWFLTISSTPLVLVSSSFSSPVASFISTSGTILACVSSLMETSVGGFSFFSCRFSIFSWSSISSLTIRLSSSVDGFPSFFFTILVEDSSSIGWIARTNSVVEVNTNPSLSTVSSLLVVAMMVDFFTLSTRLSVERPQKRRDWNYYYNC